jgi:hypothetical protein
MDLWHITDLTLNVAAWSANPYFNYFFTLISFWGLVSFAVGSLVGVIPHE